MYCKFHTIYGPTIKSVQFLYTPVQQKKTPSLPQANRLHSFATGAPPFRMAATNTRAGATCPRLLPATSAPANVATCTAGVKRSAGCAGHLRRKFSDGGKRRLVSSAHELDPLPPYLGLARGACVPCERVRGACSECVRACSASGRPRARARSSVWSDTSTHSLPLICARKRAPFSGAPLCSPLSALFSAR